MNKFQDCFSNIVSCISFNILKLVFSKHLARIRSSFNAPDRKSQIIPHILKKRSIYTLDAGKRM